MDIRICKRCRKEKAPTDFPKNKAYEDGIDIRCKQCWKDYKTGRGKTVPKVRNEAPEVIPDNIEIKDVGFTTLPKGKYFFEWSGKMEPNFSDIIRRTGLNPKSIYRIVTRIETRWYLEHPKDVRLSGE